MGEILAFVLYFVAMLSIGLFFFIKSRSKNEAEYFLGGRGMGPWVTAMSAQASDMSAWLLMGLPGSILAFGLGQAWIGIGLALGTIANWIFVAARLRRFSKAANDSITFPQYLSNRFVTKNPALQIICAVIFLVCFTVYVASAFVAGTTVFTSVFPKLDPNTARLIFAVIIIIYTFLGGFKAVCWTDFFQGILMLVALLAVPVVIVLTKDVSAAAITDITVGETTYGFTANPFAADWKEIVSGLAWGLGYFGMPHIIVRFMSIKKASMVKKSATVAIIWVVISLTATIFVAYFGRMLIGQQLLENSAQSTVFIELSRMLFPSFIAGILLAAIIAASMSTADSQLLVASSSFTSDIYKPVFRKNASDKEVLWVGRIVVLLVSVVAYFVASSKGEGANVIMNLVENAWAGFGAAFGPVVLLSLYWKRFTYAGAVAGIVSGGATVVLWIAFLSKSTGIYELFPGFIVCLVFSVVVSLLTKAPSKEVTALFEKATDKNFDD
ncbi:MAG: sodium/proline symporter PutP [Clostridia bacterium]|nr:sodium/proline symporter PutP [Clostridia bacterium]